MTATIATCIVVACDLCGRKLYNEEAGDEQHFTDVQDAIGWAEMNADRWLIRRDGYAICDFATAAHEAARAAQTPPAPAPPRADEKSTAEHADWCEIIMYSTPGYDHDTSRTVGG